MILPSKATEDAEDQTSIHTLVQQPTVSFGPKTPTCRIVTTLTFTSLGFAGSAFVFAVISFPLSPLHTIPILVAFAISIPVHSCILFAIRCLYFDSQNLPSSIPGAKIKKLSYIVLIQVIAWLVAAVMCGQVLASQWHLVGDFCKSWNRGESAFCEGRAQVVFTTATVLAWIEVLVSGLVMCSLRQWYSNSEPQGTNISEEGDGMKDHFLTVSLTIPSIIFSLPPFIISLIYIGRSKTIIFAIPTFLAYILVVAYQINVILSWWATSKDATKPFEPLKSKDCIGYMIFTGITWLASAVTAILYVSKSSWLENACSKASSPQKCQGQMHVCLIISAVSTCLHILALGALTANAVVAYRRRQRTDEEQLQMTEYRKDQQ